MGVPGAGQDQESALGTRVVLLSPRGKPLGFSAPALPGPGLAALFPVFGRGSQLGQREISFPEKGATLQSWSRWAAGVYTRGEKGD